jgi:hypothetical protein
MRQYQITWSPLAEESYLNTLSQILRSGPSKKLKNLRQKLKASWTD